MKRWRLFPRSLRQLVLMAFLLVLLPLLVLAWQAWESLSALSNQAADTNRNTFTDVRRSEAMARTAIELERSYRQYCVLGDETLAHLYQSQRVRYDQMLSSHAASLPELPAFRVLSATLPQLETLQCTNGNPAAPAAAALERFSDTNAQMVQATREVVFSRGLQLQREIADRGQFFGWQALILFLISLALVLLFTGMIIGPVKRVERMINRLGEGKALGDSVSFGGPREIRSLGQRIVWLSERLSWLETQRHEFLRHLSHELKTPLASLREGTELLADQVAGPLNSEQQEVVAILDTSSRHLQRLIEQLLDYNRKLADGPMALETVALDSIIDTVVKAHSLPAHARQMNTHVDLQVNHCLAETTLLQRVIDNLYSNAVNYGSESGNIWLHSQQKGDEVWIEVANTGTPIPAEEQAMIFEPFYQGSQQRKGPVKGSGLGLSIAKDCLRRMQGDLQLVTRKDADVCFRIILTTTAGNA
ncbi:sensor histidine kinase [Pantoea phytobeneficialis]|uniref:histidine kinase n=1 Tax=Pantoea phytobeneficialis TaxID=2052056 RepID=A0AAP9H690_9GAMM|nr:HAMP domain-containing sensor histidine kinase [Pantoea phytobeneficialis]MDO6408926.1 HAMP domain-containing sensor histidine kinase [Pantoea phytobeneficialis]QGR07428.1 two-component sensor histidine kinase [Pantoea phytobeneficialis]